MAGYCWRVSFPRDFQTKPLVEVLVLRETLPGPWEPVHPPFSPPLHLLAHQLDRRGRVVVQM